MTRHPKPDFCQGCPITELTEGYVPLKDFGGDVLAVGSAPGEVEIETGIPFTGGTGAWWKALLRKAKLSFDSVSLTNVIGCHPPNNVFPMDQAWRLTDRETAKAAVAYCIDQHLRPAVRSKPWRKIYALGNEALNALTGRNAIKTWRGSPLQVQWEDRAVPPRVMPTLHPAAIARQADLFSVVVMDLQKSLTLPREWFNLNPTLQNLKDFHGTHLTFDLEWDEHDNITLCGFTDHPGYAWVYPFCEPYVAELKRVFEEATDLYGHNIVGADLPCFERLGWNVTARLHDTMLQQHLVQPDYPHGLGFVASIFTSAVHWKGRDTKSEDTDRAYPGEQWRTWDSPNAIPREFGGYGGCATSGEAYRLYNARDVARNHEIVAPLAELLKRYNQEPVYWNVSLPAAHICSDLRQRGWPIDGARSKMIRDRLTSEITQLEKELPRELRTYYEPCFKHVPVPPGTYKPKVKTCKGLGKDGTSHAPVEIVISTPLSRTCPVCGKIVLSGKMPELKIKRVASTRRTVPWNSPPKVQAYADSIGCKVIEHKKTGRPTSDKTARKVWARKYPEFSIVNRILKRSKMVEAFARPSLEHETRLYFRLNVIGTAEGRFSCAGERKGIDLNVQQIPKVARTIFLPEQPGYALVQADWKSGENWLTAWIAKDDARLKRLGQSGYDEHADLASRFMGKSVVKDGANAELRAVGKTCNHAMNYGMGERLLQSSLSDEGFDYSLPDIRDLRRQWELLNPGTASWQRDTIALARKQGFLTNVFGRTRWLTTKDLATKGLAFLPASTLADMMIRCMVALEPGRFVSELAELKLAHTEALPAGWILKTQVHDSLVASGPDATHREAAGVLERVMAQPWKELDGFALSVDVEYSTESWGDMKALLGPTALAA